MRLPHRAGGRRVQLAAVGGREQQRGGEELSDRCAHPRTACGSSVDTGVGTQTEPARSGGRQRQQRARARLGARPRGVRYGPGGVPIYPAFVGAEVAARPPSHNPGSLPGRTSGELYGHRQRSPPPSVPWARLREVRRKSNRFGSARGRPSGWPTAVHPASACRLPRRPSGRKRAQPSASPFVVGFPARLHQGTPAWCRSPPEE